MYVLLSYAKPWAVPGLTLGRVDADLPLEGRMASRRLVTDLPSTPRRRGVELSAH
ncbi:MAG: hypothetical protein ABWK05_09885 [Pyrobaculum sp.]